MPRTLFAIAIAALACAPLASADEPPLDLGGVTEKHEMIPMRDGVRLSAYLYFPPGEGPWPVLLEQRYANPRGVSTRQSLARLAKGGYVVAIANFRGAQESEGTWVGYRALGWGELKDGYDLVEWLAAQKWSTGKIGTFGGSQAGYAQNFLAVTQPPHLVAQFMTDTGLSLFQEGYRIGGATRPERFKGMDANCRVPAHNRALLAEWFSHPTYDDYWKVEDCSLHFAEMNVPCFTLGSWFDFMCQGSVESYIGRQRLGGPNSRGKQKLLIGPWLHGGSKANKIGDLEFPENAKFGLEEQMLKWFDHYLQGKDNGVERQPAVRYYVMGATGEKDAPGNEWRSADDWPMMADPTSYFLHADRTLSQKRSGPGEDTVTFLSDPLHPATIPGTAFPGAKDAREFEKQAEVRTFTTDVLTEPVEWTGDVKAELLVSSDAPDTDFIVRISDVYPDGRSILIADYVRRARYRDGFEKEAFLKPGEIYKVAFHVGWMSQIFNRGHRIRVTVASTGAPFYEPNPNTGEPLTIDFPVNARVAKNAVHVSAQRASRVIAPVRRAGL